MSTRSLKTISKDYNETLLIASRDTDTLPTQTAAAWKSKIQESKGKLQGLRRELEEALVESAVAIFLTGDKEKTSEALDVIENEGGNVQAIDLTLMYQKIAHAVAPSVSGGQFSGTQVILVYQKLKDFALETGYEPMLYMPALEASNTTANDIESTTRLVKDIVERANGNALNLLYVSKQIVDKAIKDSYEGGAYGVVFLNATEQDRQTLKGVFKNTSTVELKPEHTVTKTFIEQQFKAAKKPNKKNNEKE
jgi:hypothetical protein